MDRSLFHAPILKAIFTNILGDKKQYCIICFRTDDEARLVTPIYFKMYIQATNIGSNVDECSICYMCEQKCKNALLLHRSAMYSSTIQLIFEELINRGVVDENIIFKKRYFSKLLNCVGLSGKLTPPQIQKELQYIRIGNTFKQTNVIVTDSTQAMKHTLGKVGTQQNDTRQNTTLKYATISKVQSVLNIESNSQGREMIKEPDAYVVLDDDDDDQTKLVSDVTNSPHGVPTNLHLLTELPNPNMNSINVPPKILTMEDVKLHQNDANFVLHAIHMKGENNYTIPSLNAEIVNNNVILYDLAKNVIHTQPMPWSIDVLKQNTKLHSKIALKDDNNVNKQLKANTIAFNDNSSIKMLGFDFNNILNKNTPLLHTANGQNMVVLNTSNSPSRQNDHRLLQNITDSCQIDAIIVNSIDTNQSMNLVLTNDNNSNGPMFLTNGVVSNANSVAKQNNTAAVNYQNNNIALLEQTAETITDSCQSGYKNKKNATRNRNKRKKLVNIAPKIEFSKSVTGNTTKISCVVVSNVKSDTYVARAPENVDTDWEDKIPMDVISFIDAVDPNADKSLIRNMGVSPSNIQISEAISLANQAKTNIMDTDVIDLC